jgi:hypothetical protein
MPSAPFLENYMLDNSNLAGPFDVSTLEAEVSTLVGNRSTDPVATPLRRALPRLDKLNLESGGQNYTKMVEPPRPEDAPEAPAGDPINPPHYRSHPSGIECIEITRHMNFNVGNAIKYLWRYMDKGDPIENLKKAQWYIDDEIRRLQGLR